MGEAIDWSQLLTRGTDRVQLPDELGQQIVLLSKVLEPRQIDFMAQDGEDAVEIPTRIGERLDRLAERNEVFDPAVSVAALHVMQRVLLMAVKDLGAQRIVDALLGEKSEQQLLKD